MFYGKFRSILVRTETLCLLFFATILMVVGISTVVRLGGFSVIDELYNADQITMHIHAMTSAQKCAHTWITGTLDMVFLLCVAVSLLAWRCVSLGAGVFNLLCVVLPSFRRTSLRMSSKSCC